jgi:hypothetical protein
MPVHYNPRTEEAEACGPVSLNKRETDTLFQRHAKIHSMISKRANNVAHNQLLGRVSPDCNTGNLLKGPQTTVNLIVTNEDLQFVPSSQMSSPRYRNGQTFTKPHPEKRKRFASFVKETKAASDNSFMGTSYLYFLHPEDLKLFER